MGKYRNHRQPRQDGFETNSDDKLSEPTYFQRTSATRSFQGSSAPVSVAAHTEPDQPAIDAEVVWFDAAKGFGFVKLADGSEAYLHVSILQAAGHDSVSSGEPLTVNTGLGPRGQQVARVLSVGGNRQASSNPALVEPVIAAEPSTDISSGTVRFYDAVRGFGFVSVKIGGSDVFVHTTTVARAGLTTLELGQKVNVSIKQTAKGRVAASIQLC